MGARRKVDLDEIAEGESESSSVLLWSCLSLYFILRHFLKSFFPTYGSSNTRPSNCGYDRRRDRNWAVVESLCLFWYWNAETDPNDLQETPKTCRNFLALAMEGLWVSRKAHIASRLTEVCRLLWRRHISSVSWILPPGRLTFRWWVPKGLCRDS